MNDNLDIHEILDSLDAVKENYQNNIPSKILEEEISLLTIQNENIKENFNEDINKNTLGKINWGNKNSKIIIIGSISDTFFNDTNELLNNIVQNGMKLNKDEIYFLKVKDDDLINLDNYKYVLCLGDELKNLLEVKLNTKLISSSINAYNELKVMPTYSITQIFHDKNIKRLFWNDLQNFLKELI